jgi:hypothetical protein
VLSKGAITAEFMRGEATEEELVAASAVGHGPTGARRDSDGRTVPADRATRAEGVEQ